MAYISLKALPATDLYEYNAITPVKPDGGKFLRGRVTYNRCNGNTACKLGLKFGIEAYFAPVERALALEKELRASGATAVLMVSSAGRARIKDIVPASEHREE